MRPWTDERMDHLIAGLLRTGVLLAAAFVLAGAVVHLLRHGGELADFSVFRVAPWQAHGVVGLAREALAGRGQGLALLGLLVLVATPVARVALAAFAFAAERDWAYVLVALVVLGVLAFSLFGGRA